jgi:hypothetical protein
VVGIDAAGLDVELQRRPRADARGGALGTVDHHHGPVAHHDAEVQPAVFAHHPHAVLEAELLEVEAPQGLHRLHQQVRDDLRRCALRHVDLRFGFSERTAPRLLSFLRQHAPALGHLSGVRYSGEMGHPFHVVDGETVILSLDHPFVPEGRFASLLVRDRALAESLAQGFEALWQRTLRDLKEVKFYPRT